MQKMLIKVIVILCIMCSYQSVSEEILPDDDIEDRPLSKICLHCLCQVLGCRSGCVYNTCGVFRITLGYWEAAHYKNTKLNNTQEYQECTNNCWCAARTVQRYMRHYLPAIQAKRPDRLLCENALALHLFGSQRGHHNLTTHSHRRLFSCLHKPVSKWLDADKQ